jgi:sugar phosphate isomerase/epimerase
LAEARPDPLISVITDEIAPRLDDVLAFAAEERLEALEVRQIDGANFLALPPAALKQAAELIAGAGLKVSGLATPLLKWPAPGLPFALVGDQFGFDPRGREPLDHFKAAADAAGIFATRHLRIFSHLAHDGFALAELREPLEQLLRLAEERDLVLALENEPVCNVRSLAGLAALVESYAHPRLTALLDLGNLWSEGERPSLADVLGLVPRIEVLHVKDWSAASRRHVPCGEGDVPFAAWLPAILARAAPRRLTLSIETHVPQDRTESTRRALHALRALIAHAST